MFCYVEGNELGDMARYRRWQEGSDVIRWPPRSMTLFQRYALCVGDTWYSMPLFAASTWQIEPASHVGPGLHRDLVKLELSGQTVIDKFGYEV